MEKITKQDRIKAVAKAWRKQYPKGGRARSEKIYKKLQTLNKPTEEKIEAIIGNPSWTELNCDECGRDSDVLVQLGHPPDYESSTVCMCLQCLREAVQLSK